MQTETKRQVYAGFFVRLAAFLVDIIIVNAGLMAVRIPMWIISLTSSSNILYRDFIFQYSVADILKYLLTVLYFVLLTYYTGSTLGKKLFQIRVISVEERKMTLFEVAYRETIGRFLSAVIMQLGYLLVIVQKEHRGIHDLLSDTCVIYYHEKKVYVHTQMNYRNMAPNSGYTVPPPPVGGNMPPNTHDTSRHENVPLNASGNVSEYGNMPSNTSNNVPLHGNMPMQNHHILEHGNNSNTPPEHMDSVAAGTEDLSQNVSNFVSPNTSGSRDIAQDTPDFVPFHGNALPPIEHDGSVPPGYFSDMPKDDGGTYDISGNGYLSQKESESQDIAPNIPDGE